MANPYKPPTTADTSSPRAGGSLEAVLHIATLQRYLNLAAIAYLGVYLLLAGFGAGIPILHRVLVAVAALIFSVISVRIADALYGRNRAILCAVLMLVSCVSLFTILVPYGGSRAILRAVLMLVPCVGLITILVLSSGATKRIREAGFNVGFLGASTAAIRARMEAAQTECIHCAMQIREEDPIVLCKVCKQPVHGKCRKAHKARAHTES